ncbi:saccharopine dehydrogenase NADP-binding domain-containing protein [Candidatus Micrarchaeota archaeon]|nr:saccharopine dehydrogenase NADP-binding domain-containing protein [Candidatus Micrarchaeota archaeon]
MPTKSPKKRNLMVLGASGGVANAFLHHMGLYRKFFNKLVLADRNNKVLKDRFIDHKALDYIFIHKNIEIPSKEREYLELLKKYEIDIVLDITDMNSTEILEATNKAGVSYVNTAMNDEKKTVKELIFGVYPRKNQLSNAPHILCTGMNPGIVNMWVRFGIEKFGIPKCLVHFEYDTSTPLKEWKSMMTWSIHEFLVESIRDPSGIALGRRKVQDLYPNGLENREDMASILKPIIKLSKYPIGLTVLHEENLSVSYKYDIPSKFIYAVNQHTMNHLINIYEKKKNVLRKDLEIGDNTKNALDGSDTIGVYLDYPDKRVYYLNSITNGAIIGTNATYTQVAIGIFAALFALLYDKLPSGVHFVEDLFDSHFKYFMFDNMRVSEFVFKKKNGKMVLSKFTPALTIRRMNRFEHLYVI